MALDINRYNQRNSRQLSFSTISNSLAKHNMQDRKFAKSQWDDIILDWNLLTIDAPRSELASRFVHCEQRTKTESREGRMAESSLSERGSERQSERKGKKKMRNREDERRVSERRLNAHACRLNYARPAGFTIMPPRRASESNHRTAGASTPFMGRVKK